MCESSSVCPCLACSHLWEVGEGMEIIDIIQSNFVLHELKEDSSFCISIINDVVNSLSLSRQDSI